MSETERLAKITSEDAAWRHWGPYLSERAWGIVREDYSDYGAAWDFFPHDHARSKAYRWGEDGIAGISDTMQYLCFGLALWNGQDAILKERMFGLAGPQGNHGEDVKEYYFYVDSTPTHSYMKMLYKYPQAAFPYSDLVAENGRRSFGDFEYELLDTGVFDHNRYFDVMVEYGKANTDDLLIQITITNHGDVPAPCVVLPTLWFRNTWSWGYPNGPMQDVPEKPTMRDDNDGIHAEHPLLGRYTLHLDGDHERIFTENDTNTARLYGVPNATPYVKDAFHHYIVNGEQQVVNPAHTGTKAAGVYRLELAPGQSHTIRLRLASSGVADPFADFDALLQQRLTEADAFYAALQPTTLTDDEKRVQRQAFAGMLWSKQLFYY
ncbi:MAG: glucosidase, partial [Phototrophicaceae bacterium]